ncbi:hypothetical protein [Faecalibaculum rodentium]|uniref:hypothetical protein n=1 Tax=Faecalibaculum rodentium TaxID=1702221 RepID=UPI002631BDEC|nr:hypothetical protein [Faecalibaculum rodentium]
MNVWAIVVICNRRLSESPSFISAISQPDIQVVVCDNSTESLNNQEEARQAGAWYLSMQGNKGLSKAYNRSLEFIKPNHPDWVVILDDDTKLTDHYWNTLRSLKIDQAIHIPVVKTDSGMIISPAEMRRDLPVAAKDIDRIKDLTAINSGMVLPGDLAARQRYDERLFLDNVDHQFLKDCKSEHVKIEIMSTELIQDFSAEEADFDQLARRFRIFKRDTIAYYSKNPWKGRFILLKRRLRLFAQCRKLEALFL